LDGITDEELKVLQEDFNGGILGKIELDLDQLKQEIAAVEIQRYARGWLCRRKIRRDTPEVVSIEAAVTMQRYTRGWLCRKEGQVQQHAATKIQAHVRRRQATQQVHTRRREVCATTINAGARGWKGRKRTRKIRRDILELESAVTIERYTRGWLCRHKRHP
jgi:myosin-5